MKNTFFGWGKALQRPELSVGLSLAVLLLVPMLKNANSFFLPPLSFVVSTTWLVNCFKKS